MFVTIHYIQFSTDSAPSERWWVYNISLFHISLGNKFGSLWICYVFLHFLTVLWLFLATYKAAAAVIQWKSIFYVIRHILQIWLWRVLQSVVRYILLNSLEPPQTHTVRERERWTPTSLKITIDAPAVPLDYTTRSIDSEDPRFRAILEVSPMIMTHEDWVNHWENFMTKKKTQWISKQLINCIE